MAFTRLLSATTALVLVAIHIPLTAQQERPAAIPVDLVVPFAPCPVPAEGQRHLVYELHVTNFGRTDLTIERIEVVDETGTVIAKYEDQGLTGILARPGVSVTDARVIGGGLRAVAFLDAVAPIGSTKPHALHHRVTFRPVTPPAGPLQSIVESGSVAVVDKPPVTLGPPVRGGWWLASHALSNGSSHRRTLLAVDGRAQIAQRFAIDWTRIAPDGQVFHGDPARNENWAPYGADVLAVANGRVVAVQDGIPENDPTASTKAVPITLKTVGGNYVILDIGGLYVFYAHLQPGSFTVKPATLVRRGQVLAKLGNSGQSDAPHLHLHVVDAPSPLAAEGLPLVFETFDLEGHVSSLRVLTDGTGWKPSDPPSQRRYEMPVENAVVSFRK